MRWSQLRHAYGQAADVPKLLARITPNDDAGWDDLWSRLCHQGTVYSASFAALPVLGNLLASWPPRDRLPGLALAGAIIASKDVDGSRDVLMRDLTEVVVRFKTLADESLALRHWSLTALIALLAAALAFDGEYFWSRELDHLADGEFSGRCAACDRELYIAIGEYGTFVTCEDWVSDRAAVRSPINSAPPDQPLSPVARWLCTRFADAKKPKGVAWVLAMNGTATCPSCNATVNVSDAILAGAV